MLVFLLVAVDIFFNFCCGVCGFVEGVVLVGWCRLLVCRSCVASLAVCVLGLGSGLFMNFLIVLIVLM